MTTEKNQRPIWSQKRQFVSDLDASENWWLSLEVLYIGIDGSSDGNLPDLSPPLVVERRKTSEPSSMSNIDWLQWSPCRLSQTIGISVSFFILSEWGEWTHMQMMYPSLQRDDPSCGESEDGELMCKCCTHRCNRYKHYIIEMVGSAGMISRVH